MKKLKLEHDLSRAPGNIPIQRQEIQDVKDKYPNERFNITTAEYNNRVTRRKYRATKAHELMNNRAITDGRKWYRASPSLGLNGVVPFKVSEKKKIDILRKTWSHFADRCATSLLEAVRSGKQKFSLGV